jgi:Cft2 family RNA processing exonuclease
MLKFIPLGGANEVGASCYYLNLNGTGIILDSGIHPRKKGGEAFPKFDLINPLPVDFCLISHAHQDHIGSLPFLIKQFPHIRTYTTPQTIQIAQNTLHNSVRIIQDQLSEFENFVPYTHEEIDLLLRSVVDKEYEMTFSLQGLRHNDSGAVQITFLNAGHVLGSAGTLIECSNHRIFYTGDIMLSSQTLMKGAALPKTKINTLILESTYGSVDSNNIGDWNTQLKSFAKKANKVFAAGGSILVPLFAFGKAQEFLAFIYHLMLKGLLTEVNIYTGGENTTSFNLAKYWLKQKSFSIFMVGYQDPTTPGYIVANSKRDDIIKLTDYSEPQKVHCEIQNFSFPSHSKREDLLHIVKKLKPDKVILIHGDDASRDWLGYEILKNFKNVKVHLAETGKAIEL